MKMKFPADLMSQVQQQMEEQQRLSNVRHEALLEMIIYLCEERERHTIDLQQLEPYKNDYLLLGDWLSEIQAKLYAMTDTEE